MELLLVRPILAAAVLAAPAPAGEPLLRPGDRVALIGNCLVERLQHDGGFEALLHASLPGHELVVRNLGFSADEVAVRQRTAGFGSQDEWLARVRASVVVAAFGFNESFGGEAGLPKFRGDLAELLDHFAQQRFDGVAPPRVVLLSPIAWEDRGEPLAPAAAPMAAQLRRYSDAMQEVAESRGARFVDLLEPTARAYAASRAPLTINGVHLNEAGNRVVAELLVDALAGGGARPSGTQVPDALAALRAGAAEKARLWFNRYQATDGYNVYGGRSALEYDGVTNFTVLQREMEILDAQVAAWDRRLWSLAQGRDEPLDHSRVPPAIPVATNYPGPLPGGRHDFLDGAGAIERMTPAPGLRVELVADEKRFPELAKPVQMAFDAKGRLWVAAWPSYPHWAPGEAMDDKLLILEDDDGDGRADRCQTFAGGLHNPTGFEFWNGGVYVACAPDLWFLQDTDGDDVCDRRERVLHGLSSADTHHAANSFVVGPDGGLYFQEGTFHQSQIESVWGPQRNHDACVWRFEPRSGRVERHIAYDFANPHGHVFDRYGQEFVTDGTGNDHYWAPPFSGRVVHPDKHRRYFTFFRQRSRPCGGTEILASRHFPPEYQDAYLACNVIGFQGIFQYRIEDDGAGLRAHELPPLVQSSDPRFRPVDVEVAPDGTLCFLDWCNPIIGHMQHHLRDPNRDHEHGRVYRVVAPGRERLAPARIAGEPIGALLELLRAPEDRVRSRVRAELSGRDRREVIAAARAWGAAQPAGVEHDAARLEALWVQQQAGAIDEALLERLLASGDARVRAAAVRVVRHGRHQIDAPARRLAAAARDDHPRVRLEALIAASWIGGEGAAQLALDVLRAPCDKFLDYAFAETMRTLEPEWRAALAAGRLDVEGNDAAVRWLVGRAGDEELARLPRTRPVLEALVERHGTSEAQRGDALAELAREGGRSVAQERLLAIGRVDRAGGAHARHVVAALGRDLLDDLAGVGRAELVAASRAATLPESAASLAAARVVLDGALEPAWREAGEDARAIEALLAALPLLPERFHSAGRERARALLAERGEGAARVPGLQVDYYSRRLASAARESFAVHAPERSLVAGAIAAGLDGIEVSDAFALRYRATLEVPAAGEWRFFVISDDGAKLWIDGTLVVDNDGDHAMVERDGAVELAAGRHAFELCYYDAGGAQGLAVHWSGPGVPRQPVPPASFEAGRGERVRAAAARALAELAGPAAEKRADGLALLQEAALAGEAVALLASVPAESWGSDAREEAIAALARLAEGVAAEQRTRADVAGALELARRLADGLSPARAKEVRGRLRALAGATLVVRTVPHQMLYDRKELVVAAGQPVAIVFQNNDLMPHNLVVGAPGSLEAIGTAAEAMATDPGAQERSFVPALPEVLHALRLLLPGESETLRFVAPERAGDYPYVCTFPGHWRVMNGVLRVVERLDEEDEAALAAAEAAGAAGGAAAPVALRAFVRMWTLEELEPAFVEGWQRRASPARGARLFEEAGCVQCHRFRGAGIESAPALDAVATKYRDAALLKQILEPSAAILEGYEQHLFLLRDGSDVIGRIVAQDEASLTVATDLRRPGQTTVVPRSQIAKQRQSPLSAMPTGLLVTLTRDEILDLLAWLQSPPP